jgi:hypothetical protein
MCKLRVVNRGLVKSSGIQTSDIQVVFPELEQTPTKKFENVIPFFVKYVSNRGIHEHVNCLTYEKRRQISIKSTEVIGSGLPRAWETVSNLTVSFIMEPALLLTSW